MPKVNVDSSGSFLTLETQGGIFRFHAVWLRDNSQDSDTRAAGNGQRLITLKDIPADTTIDNASLTDDRLEVEFQPGAKLGIYDLDWLITNAYDRSGKQDRGWTAPHIETWDSGLMNNVPVGDYETLTQDAEALYTWLEQINRYGFGKVINGPVENGALFKIVDLFGYVRETNYGRHFEVRTEVNPTNLAFTGLGLQAHTDNPYRDPVPSIQVLYCLESSAAGGENMVVDGFATARRLRQENPAYFDVLANHCARFEYAGEEGVCLTSRRPMIELAPDGELIGVRFNNRSLAAVTEVPDRKSVV